MSRALTRTGIAVAATLMAWLGAASHALAGPIELFGEVGFAADQPDLIATRYLYGNGGFYFSRDGGKSFRLSCNNAVSKGLTSNDVQTYYVARDGSACVTTGSHTYCSDTKGCSWKEATELMGKWIADFYTDPVDGSLYLATSTSMEKNGLYVRKDGAWTPFGTQLDGWFSRLHVVKNGDAKRFYASATENITMTDPTTMKMVEEVRYFIRYSDDNAQTWTSSPFGETEGSVRLVAVDPTNADRIVVAVRRSLPMQPDDLLYSDKRGMEGSFTKIGSVTELAGVTFIPDGTLFYGDNDQSTPGLFKVGKLGDAPVKLSEGTYKIGCLGYDPKKDLLYACADWRFGTVDRETGELGVLFDIKTTAQFHECEGESIPELCEVAVRSPNLCDISHYPAAPICAEYGASAAGSGAAGGGAAGAPVAGSDAAGSAAGGSGAAGHAGKPAGGSGTGSAGKAGAAGEAAPKPPKKSDGGCASVPGPASGASALFGLIGAALWLASRRTSSSQGRASGAPRG